MLLKQLSQAWSGPTCGQGRLARWIRVASSMGLASAFSGDELGAGLSLCGISQQYKGAYATEAALMFPETASFEIVRMMVGDPHPRP